jgi:hypothetical protein
MTYSLHDTRPIDEKDLDLTCLDLIQDLLEKSIASFALERSEDLYDEEHKQIVRNLMFSQGTRTYNLVIAPDGDFRMVDRRFPIQLLAEIHNALLEIILEQ